MNLSEDSTSEARVRPDFLLRKRFCNREWFKTSHSYYSQPLHVVLFAYPVSISGWTENKWPCSSLSFTSTSQLVRCCGLWLISPFIVAWNLTTHGEDGRISSYHGTSFRTDRHVTIHCHAGRSAEKTSCFHIHCGAVWQVGHSTRDNRTSIVLFQGKFKAGVESGEEVLQEHLMSCSRRETYLSKTTQNEIILCIGEFIRAKIVADIKKSKFSLFLQIKWLMFRIGNNLA